MSTFDKEWQDGDDSAMVDNALLAVRDRLVVALGEVQKALQDIDDDENSSYRDYFEGQICAYEHAVALLEGRE